MNTPIFLMEQSLRQLLERSSTDIPCLVQVNISHDIALAVDHLHRNRILHRNLSCYNILLNAHYQAKVTGFRKSISLDFHPTLPLPMMPLQGNLLLKPFSRIATRASLIVSQLDFSFFTLPPGSYQVSDLKYKPLLLQYQREPATSLVWNISWFSFSHWRLSQRQE